MKRLFYSPLDGAARREICSTLTHLVGCVENTPTHAKSRIAEGESKKMKNMEDSGEETRKDGLEKVMNNR